MRTLALLVPVLPALSVATSVAWVFRPLRRLLTRRWLRFDSWTLTCTVWPPATVNVLPPIAAERAPRSERRSTRPVQVASSAGQTRRRVTLPSLLILAERGEIVTSGAVVSVCVVVVGLLLTTLPWATTSWTPWLSVT